jgi:microcystin-dependent protein
LAADRLTSRSPIPSAIARRSFFVRALAALAGGAFLGRARRAEAAPQSVPAFIGEIQIFAGSYAPQGWVFCDGQLLAIASYPDLFNVIGTTYGGNGTTHFAVPDLRGRVPLQPGQGPGLSFRTLGEIGGTASHAVSLAEMPSHTHSMSARAANGSTDSPIARVPARTPAAIPEWAPSADASLAAGAVGSSGGGQPHNNMQPYLTLSYIIAHQGEIPPPP